MMVSPQGDLDPTGKIRAYLDQRLLEAQTSYMNSTYAGGRGTVDKARLFLIHGMREDLLGITQPQPFSDEWLYPPDEVARARTGPPRTLDKR